MSQFSHPSQKKSQSSQENLLQGLQGSKTTNMFLSGERKNEFEGSMLLDSINHLLKQVQKKYSPIKQVDDSQVLQCEKPKITAHLQKDDAQTVLPYQIIAHQKYFDQPFQSKFQTKNIGYFLQQLPSENNEKELTFQNPNEIKLPHQLTNYNICNSEEKVSQVKKDLNSSLFVEVSDRKDLDFSQFLPMSIDLSLGKASNEVNQARENENELIIKNSIQQLITQNEQKGDKLAQIKSKHTQLSQNYSLDSSKIIQMIPLDYFQEKNDKIDSKIKAIVEKNQQIYLDQYSNKKVCFINGEKDVQIPMDIEYESRQKQIPMDIESIGLQYYPNNIPSIRKEENIQAINREELGQLEGEERCEQIEIINSIIERNPESDEIIRLKQFTFGKVDNPASLCEIKTSDQDFNLDTSINSINGNNISIQDNGHTHKLIKNLSFDHSLGKQPFQNLSLYVECDNHQLEVFDDLDCILPQSIKNQTNNKQNDEITHQIIKETIYIDNSSSENQQPEILQQPKSGLKGQNIPIMIQIQDQQTGQRQKLDFEQDKIGKQRLNTNTMKMIHNKNHDQDINEGLEKKSNQSASAIQKHIMFTPPVGYHPQISQQRKMQIHQNKLCLQNNLINYSVHPQLRANAALGQSNFYQDRSKPQVIIHNDSYNIPPQINQQYPNNYTYNSNNTYHPPLQPHYNYSPIIPLGHFRPQISINFKNNEIFVNISGPLTQNHLKCEEALGKVEEKPDINEDSTNKKINQSLISKVADTLIQKQKTTQENIQNKKALRKINDLQDFSQSQGQKESSTDKGSLSPLISLTQQQFLLKYEFIIQLAEQYLNNKQPSEENHKQFQYHISPYIYIRFTPEPKDLIGTKLFKNGIFLIALIKLISRTSSSAFLANYLVQYFQSAFGAVIEKNTYIFKCQAQVFKKRYSEELEKKYFQKLRIDQSLMKKPELLSRAQPVKRVVVHNPFLSLKSQKKDQSSQVSPTKIQKPNNVLIQTDISDIINTQPQKQLDQIQQVKHQDPFLSNQKPRNTKKSEQISELKSQKSKQTSFVKFQKNISFTQNNQKQNKNDKNEKEGKKEKNDSHDKGNLNDKSDRHDKKWDQNKLKKSEDYRSSAGLLIKKTGQPESSNKDQISRFNDLYEKYRRIRENKKTDPIENHSSIKKYIVEQAAKIQNSEQQPAKKSQRRQVMFSQETITKENERNIIDDEGQADNKKKKKMRKSKPKRDSSIEEQSEQMPISSKTRKNLAKKER